MNEINFLTQYNEDKPYLNLWGNKINEYILGELRLILPENKEFESFLKIPPVPRLKDDDSIIEKAFRRSKNYKNPYTDITDKIGIRYVVLLCSQIKIVESIIKNNPNWTFSKDSDFEQEKKDNPLVFDYQSMHYIIRNKNAISEKGVLIPKDTPCECQIRTLLQHAHSELTHDTTYKPQTRSVPEVKRLVAKSLALIEATDDIFGLVHEKIDEMKTTSEQIIKSLSAMYEPVGKTSFNKKINERLLDTYSEFIDDKTLSNIQEFIHERNWIISKIGRNYDNYFLYRQPVVLLIFYLAYYKSYVTKERWPYTDENIRQIFSDCGLSFDN